MFSPGLHIQFASVLCPYFPMTHHLWGHQDISAIKVLLVRDTKVAYIRIMLPSFCSKLIKQRAILHVPTSHFMITTCMFQKKLKQRGHFTSHRLEQSITWAEVELMSYLANCTFFLPFDIMFYPSVRLFSTSFWFFQRNPRRVIFQCFGSQHNKSLCRKR